MSEHTPARTQQAPRISQVVMAGTLGSPQTFTVVLLLCAALMGWSISKAYDVQSAINRNNTELRLLQEHLSNLSAILIRNGIKKPEDDTAGPNGH